MAGIPAIFATLTPLGLPVARFCALLGFDVRYGDQSVARDEEGVARLAAQRIRPLDLEHLPMFEPALTDSDPLGTIAAGVELLMPQQAALCFAPLFRGVSKVPDKLRLAARMRLERDFNAQSRIAAWVQASRLRRSWVLIWAPWSSADMRSWGWARYVNLSPWRLGQAVRLFAKVAGRLLSVPRRAGAAATSGGDATRPDLPGDAVLFFPHGGVLYNGLFEKNYFYSPDPASPLHRDRIRHLEVDVCAETFKPAGIAERLVAVVELLRFAVGQRELLRRLPSPLRTVTLLTHLYAQFVGWREALKPYARAPLAIIGYEVLFPKTLAMALEAKRIPTVAVQERFISTFYASHSLLVDTYFCASSFVAEHFATSGRAMARRYVPLGLVRTDLLRKFRAEGASRPTVAMKEGARLVVALSFHTELDAWASMANPILNWSAHRVFIEDMIRLARELPDVHIVIRGKNAQWVELEVFRDLIAAIDAQDNIEVHVDYSRLNLSYELCANAALVIAKHTSLGDECLAVGIPVLFHEYAHNFRELVGAAFSYPGTELICRDFATLKEQAERILSGEQQAPDLQWLYGNLNDGHVSERLREVISKELLACRSA